MTRNLFIAIGLAVLLLAGCAPRARGQCPCGCQGSQFSFQQSYQFSSPQVYESSYSFSRPYTWQPSFGNYSYYNYNYFPRYSGRPAVFSGARFSGDGGGRQRSFSAGFSSNR